MKINLESYYSNCTKDLQNQTNMNRKLFCLSVLFFSTLISYGQEKTETDIINLTKITFLNPGISYEHRIGKLQSLYFQAFMNTSAGVSYSSSFGWNSGIYFDPALTAQYRYYYNAKKRESKGKRTEWNNLNYLAGISDCHPPLPSYSPQR